MNSQWVKFLTVPHLLSPTYKRLYYVLAYYNHGYWLTAGLQWQDPHYWNNSSPEMTFITHCQQPQTSAPSISRSQFTAYKDFLSLTLFTLSKEEKEKGKKKRSKMLLCIQPFKRAPPWSTILARFFKHFGKTLTLPYHCRPRMFGNEDSFGFHLVAQSIFWLSAKLCVLDESKMSVSILWHWEQRQEYVNCWPDLSQQTRVHKQDTP